MNQLVNMAYEAESQIYDDLLFFKLLWRNDTSILTADMKEPMIDKIKRMSIVYN